ncbi:yqaJ domain-containing protein [Nephila pilipes]|uniref:YqaJ domain-containing protein n=1 Tax=Nephila pilipes TaxID=299642 RepID=A0A8X6UA54_NEPPI|nr:yqaJ domain-containing protein [Nephila pilipes]
MVCSRAAIVSKIPGKHCCIKFWHGSSSNMEANIIQEGFQYSVLMYRVKYAKVIEDGDSNVYKTAADSKSYDEFQVKQLEYQNHLLMKFCLKLKDIIKYIKARPMIMQKCIGKKYSTFAKINIFCSCTLNEK